MKDIIKEHILGSIAFWVCLCTSLVLIILGFVVPPMGDINPSVLTAVGEIFGFATLAVVGDAIHLGYDAKVRKGDVEVEISNKDD